jgi:hypothetical protein
MKVPITRIEMRPGQRRTDFRCCEGLPDPQLAPPTPGQRESPAPAGLVAVNARAESGTGGIKLTVLYVATFI